MRGRTASEIFAVGISIVLASPSLILEVLDTGTRTTSRMYNL